MTVSPELRVRLYARANGRCECTDRGCWHHAGQRCPRDLDENWEPHRRALGGADLPDNLIALCQTCRQRALVSRRI